MIMNQWFWNTAILSSTLMLHVISSCLQRMKNNIVLFVTLVKPDLSSFMMWAQMFRAFSFLISSNFERFVQCNQILWLGCLPLQGNSLERTSSNKQRVVSKCVNWSLLYCTNKSMPQSFLFKNSYCSFMLLLIHLHFSVKTYKLRYQL